jgi:hypothetical protein
MTAKIKQGKAAQQTYSANGFVKAVIDLADVTKSEGLINLTAKEGGTTVADMVMYAEEGWAYASTPEGKYKTEFSFEEGFKEYLEQFKDILSEVSFEADDFDVSLAELLDSLDAIPGMGGLPVGDISGAMGGMYGLDELKITDIINTNVSKTEVKFSLNYGNVKKVLKKILTEAGKEAGVDNADINEAWKEMEKALPKTFNFSIKFNMNGDGYLTKITVEFKLDMDANDLYGGEAIYMEINATVNIKYAGVTITALSDLDEYEEEYKVSPDFDFPGAEVIPGAGE